MYLLVPITVPSVQYRLRADTYHLIGTHCCCYYHTFDIYIRYNTQQCLLSRINGQCGCFLVHIINSWLEKPWRVSNLLCHGHFPKKEKMKTINLDFHKPWQYFSDNTLGYVKRHEIIIKLIKSYDNLGVNSSVFWSCCAFIVIVQYSTKQEEP